MRFVALLILGVILASAGGARAQQPEKGWLGAEVADLTKEEAAKLGWPNPRGAKVVGIEKGSPAAAAGLAKGDVIDIAEKRELDGKGDFDKMLAARKAGAVLSLRVKRKGWIGGVKDVALSVTLVARSQVANVEEAPIPMLDTGGHMAKVSVVVFTPDGRQIVSASDDKVVRVWDVATGMTVRTFRGEAEPGHAGKVYALALSPDGKWLAAGGWMKTPGDEGHHVRLYDFASGKLVALLKGHDDITEGLAFSPDSRRLISGSGDNTAIIWDVATAKALHKLVGHNGDIYAVGFTPDGARVVTGAYDNDLRLWSVESGALLATMKGHNDKVRSLAVARDGRIVSGDKSGEIRQWDGRTGAFVKTLAQQKTEVGGLAFSPDGKTLLSGAGFQGNGFDCHVWDAASGKETLTYTGHDNIVLAVAISPDGRWAATGGGDGEEIHIWDLKTGERRRGADGLPLTLGGSGRPFWVVAFSADGRQIAWGNKWSKNDRRNGYGALEYALTLPEGDSSFTGPVPVSEEAFHRATADMQGWSLSHRKGGKGENVRDAGILDIKQGERVVASIPRGVTDGFQHRSYNFTYDGGTVISGASAGVLTAYRRDTGEKIGDYVGHEGDVWANALSPDGRYLVSGADDQTLRLWNLKTRELLITLFNNADGEWVMWTPQGYYASSPAGAGLIGWQINHGAESAAGYVTAAQLRKSLYRPDIVAKAIQLASAEAAAKQSAGTNFKLADLLARPVPRLRIVSPVPNATLTSGTAQLELLLDRTPDPVSVIRLYVNGAQVPARPEKNAELKTGRVPYKVPLARGHNVIRAVAVNDAGETSAEIAVTLDGEGGLDKRGTLHILAIGVNKYPGLGRACVELDGKTPKICDLTAPAADASAFAAAMAAQLGPLHKGGVLSTVLVNGGERGEPTTAKIVDALDELRGAAPNDTIMLFVSGHGLHEGQDYYFVPTDAEFAGGRLRKSTAVPWAQFQSVLDTANGRRFLFLDTCRSGNRYSQRLTNEAYEQNIVIYTAARWDQDALERDDLGGGLFTHALVEGVEGAAKDKSGDIRAESLRDYVRTRVRELAKPLGFDQEPQFVKGRDAENYLLARAP